MKKNNQHKEILLDAVNSSDFVGNIPNPIPSWLGNYFKKYNLLHDNINDGIIEGYHTEDDF